MELGEGLAGLERVSALAILTVAQLPDRNDFEHSSLLSLVMAEGASYNDAKPPYWQSFRQ